jgi:hypothetical protein
MTAPLETFHMNIITHKGDVIFVFSKPVSKLPFSVEDADKILEILTNAIKQARSELENEKPVSGQGRRPS